MSANVDSRLRRRANIIGGKLKTERMALIVELLLVSLRLRLLKPRGLRLVGGGADSLDWYAPVEEQAECWLKIRFIRQEDGHNQLLLPGWRLSPLIV